jgi:hypothetical protein
MMSRYLFAITMASIAGAAWGQIGAPLLGYIPDGAQIRPVTGIPAAAAVGAPLDLKQDFAQIAASPSQDYALVSEVKTGAVSVYTADRGLTRIVGAGLAPSAIAISPRGAAAALWFSASGTAQVLTGLPAAPAIRTVHAEFLNGMPDALALSDDGKWLLASQASAVYTFGSYGQVNRLPMPESVVALAFFPGRADAVVATAQRILTVKGLGGFTATSTLYQDKADPPLDFRSAAVSSDGASVIAAGQTGSIVSIDGGSGKAIVTGCACQPAGLFAMGPSAFRLTGLSNGSILLFDATHGEVLFAPVALAKQEEAAGGSQ